MSASRTETPLNSAQKNFNQTKEQQ
jgi:hypothetical protein